MSPNFSKGWKQTPKGIVIHYTASSVKNSDISWFENLASKVSCHNYIDRDGHVAEIVSLSDRAWHAGISQWAGNSGCNNFTIGIELANIGKTKSGQWEPYPEAQLVALIETIKHIKTKWPLINDSWIVGHNHISPGRKIDPGPAFPWDRISDTFAQTNKMNDVMSMQSHLERLDFELGEIDGYWGKATSRELEECSKKYSVIFTENTLSNIRILRKL